MYEAKKRRRGFHRYSTGDDSGAARRLKLAGQLGAALLSAEIEVHYQPTIQLSDGRCEILEAVVRWNHPEYGVIQPCEFVPLAEQYGLGLDLFKRVIRDALAQCSYWRAEQLARSVAVNVAPETLVDPGFLEVLVAALAEGNLSADALVVELTENAFVGEAADVRSALKRIAFIGVGIAIDDFGTGYSSLAHLKRLPVDAVKLDRAFTKGLGNDPANNAIVAVVTDLVHRLGLVVIAEGVETHVELEALRRHGCDVVQGYYICRPAPASVIAHWLAEHIASNELATSD